MGHAVSRMVEYIYIHGPASLGMWEGMPREHICAHLSTIDSLFFHSQPDACQVLLKRKAHAYTVVVVAFTLCVTAYRILPSLLPAFATCLAPTKDRHGFVRTPRLHLTGLDTPRMTTAADKESRWIVLLPDR